MSESSSQRPKGRAAPSVGTSGVSSPQRALSRRHVLRLHAASLSPTPDACLAAARTMLRAGIGEAAIVDQYIPAVARQLGKDWVDDRASFAQVTVGTARLQSLLREMEPKAEAETRAACLLVCVPENVHHTLGPMVLVNNLRRLGFSVRLMLAATPAAVQAVMKRTSFQAVFLSSAEGDDPVRLRHLVRAVRASARVETPVVAGGTILNSAPALCALTGADHATSDITEALTLCGLLAKARRA